MFCPQCYGEYREGFTTCATCEVTLVESLSPAIVAELQARPATKLDGFILEARRRWSEVSPISWLLIAWFLTFSLFWAVRWIQWAPRVLASGLPSSESEGAVTFAAVFQGLFLVLLPLLSAAAIFLGKPWAWAVCLPTLAGSCIHSMAMVLVIWHFASQNRSVVTGTEPGFTLQMAWYVAAGVVHLAAFVYIYRLGRSSFPRGGGDYA